MKGIGEIKTLIEARYDLIYVNSFEEVRVVDEIYKISDIYDIDIDTWSFASGLKSIDNTDPGVFSGDPVGVIKRHLESKKDVVLVLKDYHLFLKDAEVISAIKDCVHHIKNHYTPIIILSPILKIPVELEKEIAIVDFPLPESDDIGEIINMFLEQVGNVSLSDEDREDIIKSCMGLTASEIVNILARSYIENDRQTIKHKDILLEKKQVIRKNGILEYIDTNESMDNVGGINNLKLWLSQRKIAFTDKAVEFGLPIPKGLVLTGVPGCGKSLVCKAISSHWKMPLLKLDMGAIMGSLVGSSEENMRKALQVAEAISPCILFIDELEKGLSGTSSSNHSDAGTTSRVFSTLLTWLQDRKKPVFVIATANDISQLPSELLRQGRFDDIFFVDLPTAEEREEIFKIHLSKRGRDPNKFLVKKLAIDSDGFSGAEIEQTIIDAMFNVFVAEEGNKDINHMTIVEALSVKVPLSRTKKDDIDRLRLQAREIAKPAN